MTAVPLEKHAANAVTFALNLDARPQALTRSIEEE
jgi:hypothetical protein